MASRSCHHRQPTLRPSAAGVGTGEAGLATWSGWHFYNGTTVLLQTAAAALATKLQRGFYQLLHRRCRAGFFVDGRVYGGATPACTSGSRQSGEEGFVGEGTSKFFVDTTNRSTIGSVAAGAGFPDSTNRNYVTCWVAVVVAITALPSSPDQSPPA